MIWWMSQVWAQAVDPGVETDAMPDDPEAAEQIPAEQIPAEQGEQPTLDPVPVEPVLVDAIPGGSEKWEATPTDPEDPARDLAPIPEAGAQAPPVAEDSSIEGSAAKEPDQELPIVEEPVVEEPLVEGPLVEVGLEVESAVPIVVAGSDVAVSVDAAPDPEPEERPFVGPLQPDPEGEPGLQTPPDAAVRIPLEPPAPLDVAVPLVPQPETVRHEIVFRLPRWTEEPQTSPFGFLLLGMGLLLLASLSERLREKLGKDGALPAMATFTTVMGRFLAVPTLLFAAVSFLPDGVRDTVPYVFVAIALALGWTTRWLLADLFSGIVIFAERRFAEGDRIAVDSVSGIVTAVGFRSTQIRTDDQRVIAIPNRQLVSQVVAREPTGFLQVRVELSVSEQHSNAEVRQTLLEFAHASPFVAPVGHPDVFDYGEGKWLVEAHLVDPRYRDAFQGALYELTAKAFTP